MLLKYMKIKYQKCRYITMQQKSYFLLYGLCKDKKSFLILFKNSVKLLILNILNIWKVVIVLSFKINNLNLQTDIHYIKYSIKKK